MEPRSFEPTGVAPGSAPPRPPQLPSDGWPPAPPAWPEPYDPYAWGGPGGLPPGPPPKPSPAWMEFPTDRPPPRWGMGDVFAGLAAWLLASFLFAVPAVIASGSEEITGLWAVVALVGSWTGMIGWLLYASRRKGFGTMARDFGFRFRWIDPLIGFGVGFLTLMVTGIVSQVVAKLAGEEPVGNAEAIFSGQEGNSVGLVLLAIGGAIGAPIVEELFFRGLALRAIERRYGAVAGVVGSTAVFTLLHFQPGSWLDTVTLFGVIGVYGAVLAVLAHAFRRLGPSIFAHMTINGIGVAFLVYTTLWR